MDVRIEIPASSSTESYYSVQTHRTSSEENIDIPLQITSVDLDDAELDISNASIETVVANQKPPNNQQKKVSFVKTVIAQPAAVDFVDLDEIIREEGKESEKSSDYVFYEYETVFPQEDHDLRMQILPKEAFRVRFHCFKLTEIRSILNLEFLRKMLIKTWLTLVINLIFLILFIIYSQLFIFLIYSTLDEHSTITNVSRVCLLTVWAIQICMLAFGFVNIFAAACRNPGLLFKDKLNEIYANTKSITGIDNTAVEMDPLETRLVLYSRIIIELKLCQVKSFLTVRMIYLFKYFKILFEFQYCKLYRTLDTYHCFDCGTCIAKQRYHIDFLNNCIGKQNRDAYDRAISSFKLLAITVSTVIVSTDVLFFEALHILHGIFTVFMLTVNFALFKP